ncbi:hypothetical protein PPL_04082 [Heterostelium album PN500]|uniref:BTB domain-containing protein n=1 Tax=Heterostelium pallidum (strain ATCC 26659 / Pp 5 / PN500) TaxID=670386 RepID=D3B5Z4_HETP5|nr:hypothetical protein PPL_04082 [Heterostelium album PN500]EFA83292.1 hypothetical protein PPL_04082 [Heterostelium album PN500]|eukprot:XP_020435409.1 hypothetical protein PPL_04082 [Heterostelium album PN500]
MNNNNNNIIECNNIDCNNCNKKNDENNNNNSGGSNNNDHYDADVVGKKVNNNNNVSVSGDRVVLNVGGRRFETYKSTFSVYPTSLLGVMFSERNRHLLCPDENGEFFFDRSSSLFESILDFYRTGGESIEPPIGYNWRQLQKEIDYFQLPIITTRYSNYYINTTTTNNNNNNNSNNSNNNNNNTTNGIIHLSSSTGLLLDDPMATLGERLFKVSLHRTRTQLGDTLQRIKDHIIETLFRAAEQGKQTEIIQFKSTSSGTEEFYSFVSNLRNRELLLHDLMNEGLDVSFSEEFSSFYHSYLFQVTFWTRYTRNRNTDMPPTADQVLNEFKQKITQLADIMYNKK